jgi:cyclophilin family peptidyl-prolyl cis-trans isomerase
MRIPGFFRPLALVAALLLAFGSLASEQPHPRVRVDTSLGSFVIELDPERAPLSVANFLEYVKAGQYTDTVFHRVIGTFVIQGGGFDTNYVEKAVRAGVPNESGNGLSNRRGTVGVARTGDAHSGTAQFYVNLGDNAALDPQPSRWGYAVFGQVVDGMKVVDDIGAVATGSVGPFEKDAPLQPIVIKKIVVL